MQTHEVVDANSAQTEPVNRIYLHVDYLQIKTFKLLFKIKIF